MRLKENEKEKQKNGKRKNGNKNCINNDYRGVLVVNIETSEVGTKHFILGQDMTKDEKAMLKASQEMMNEEAHSE